MTDLIDHLQALLEEDFPKPIQEKITEAINALQDSNDGMTVSRTLADLGELADSADLQSHHRMLLYNVVSLLETV